MITSKTGFSKSKCNPIIFNILEVYNIRTAIILEYQSNMQWNVTPLIFVLVLGVLVITLYGEIIFYYFLSCNTAPAVLQEGR